MLQNNVVWGRGLYSLGAIFLNNVLENMGKYNSQIVQFGETGTGKQRWIRMPRVQNCLNLPQGTDAKLKYSPRNYQ